MSSDSEFEDPDNLEVPGGGKDLASLVCKDQKVLNIRSYGGIERTVPCQNVGGAGIGVISNSNVTKSTNLFQVLSSHNSSFNGYNKALIVDKQALVNDKSLSTSCMNYIINLAKPNDIVSDDGILLNNNIFIDRKHFNFKTQMGNVLFQQSSMSSTPLVVNPSRIVQNEIENNEEEGMGVAETYENYMPAKLKIGLKHPDPVVESTSLSSVPPADVWYKLIIPEETITSGSLSALQLESITYVCQQHERKLPDGSRGGFLIGDGAGVGKGRTIAGIIFENYLRGRKKAIWVSIMTDLKLDAERDLSDIGASKIHVYSLNKCKYTKLSSDENGKIKKGVIFCTYSSIIAKTTQSTSLFETRFQQVVDWCGTDFDGVLVFDECHKAKNLNFKGIGRSTKTGQVVLELQKKLPNARVVYASATGATEPKNMAYMVRLGMWGPGTPYKDFSEFHSILNKRGVGVMEIVAMDMKLRGLYMARQLSFHGVIFKIIEVSLSERFKKVYDNATALWAEAAVCFRKAMDLIKLNKSSISVIWSQFWGSHQRFFKYMCISAKVKKTVSITREAVKCGKCVVIGLQSTGEARTLQEIDKEDGELNDFVSTAYGVLKSLVEKHFPEPTMNNVCTKNAAKVLSKEKKERSRVKRRRMIWNIPLSDESSFESDSSLSDNTESQCLESWQYDNVDLISNIHKMKRILLRKIEDLGKQLPPNALDELIDELGGPDNVAEMTGRKGRIVQNDGNFKYESRSDSESSLEVMNLIEKQRFMDGEKDVAIISEAASSGISLHSDKRAINKRCRVHITLELPWSADKAIQQFGRTHRSNQKNAPEYILLISDLGGERRFASVVAKRLECLGALTQGDRRATEARDLSKFNIDNNYGRMAVEITLKSFLPYNNERLVSPPSSYVGDFMKDAEDGLKRVGLLTSNENGSVSLDIDRKSLGKFLNRILGLPVDLQNAIFEYFTDTMEAVIERAKNSGHFDLGILDVATSDQFLKRLSVQRFIRPHVTGLASTELHRVEAERGMTWEEALRIWEKATSAKGFYLSQPKNNNREVILAVEEGESSKNTEGEHFVIYRPNVGRQVRKEPKSSILRKFKFAKRSDAKLHWQARYHASSNICSHQYWGGICKRSLLGECCDVGLRRRVYNILSGSVLSVWNTIENIISKGSSLQVVRVKTTDGGKIVGTLVPPSCVEPLISALSLGAEKVVSQQF